ncbi:hypothetical protein [Streptomyces sp. JNUCC 63]
MREIYHLLGTQFRASGSLMQFGSKVLTELVHRRARPVALDAALYLLLVESPLPCRVFLGHI